MSSAVKISQPKRPRNNCKNNCKKKGRRERGRHVVKKVKIKEYLKDMVMVSNEKKQYKEM